MNVRPLGYERIMSEQVQLVPYLAIIYQQLSANLLFLFAAVRPQFTDRKRTVDYRNQQGLLQNACW